MDPFLEANQRRAIQGIVGYAAPLIAGRAARAIFGSPRSIETAYTASGHKRRRVNPSVSTSSSRRSSVSSLSHPTVQSQSSMSSRRSTASRSSRLSSRSRKRRSRRVRRSRKPSRKSKRLNRKYGSKVLRKRLLNILTVPNNYIVSFGDIEQTPAASATTGKGVVYFTGSGVNSSGTQLLNNQCIDNINRLQAVAFQIDPTANARNLKWFRVEDVIKYQLINQSNGHANIVAYYCRVRENILSSGQNYFNIINLLDAGFKENAVSDGLVRDEITPFQSLKFCGFIKISKVKKFVMSPGEELSLSLKTFKVRTIVMQKFFNANGTTTWKATAPDYQWIKGNKFILFKLTGQPADNAVGGGFTFTAPKIDMSTTTRMVYKWVQDDVENILEANAVGITAGVAPTIMTEETDTVATDTAA